ncbi:hypothetical protein GCM10011371_12270 [Novosphingobium marinum]|uniref:Secreted protein n=2 Tax=Novosphingobium marinum TaxID=1514948 RepID=A0A7Y9XVE9_9SPHN|nr:hypothetical protein [Novosphingobium marinum]NYH95336.1 hypothetical protein [Novosphingobium marinum]GGC26250.1 hypothetical protein GCM10011371_12270 [Novosphingobium marinum]
MKNFVSRPAVAIAAAAALSLTATPAMARGYGDWHRYRHHHDRGIDGGDVLAGVLIIGGIAAIAAAASKSSRDRNERDYPGRPPRPGEDDWRDYGDDRDDRDRDDDYARGATSRSLDAAADACVFEVERGEIRIESIDSVERTRVGYDNVDGWDVAGRLEDGRAFACTVDTDMRIRRASVDGRAVY